MYLKKFQMMPVTRRPAATPWKTIQVSYEELLGRRAP